MINLPTFVKWAVLASLPYALAHAQDTQFVPEVTQHFKLSSNIRVLLQAKDDREGGDPQQFTFGPSVEFHLKPLLKLKNATLFDLDDAKKRPLVFESGYRVITAPNRTATNRAIEAVTFHVPFAFRTLISDENRADLNWQAGAFTWRYRNKLALQRTIPISGYHLIPYVAAEPFYESQYRKWSTTDLYVGALLPAGKHLQFDAYYEHENNTGKSPNRQNNFIGLALHLYFSRKGSQ
jgi:hypothetical protein